MAAEDLSDTARMGSMRRAELPRRAREAWPPARPPTDSPRRTAPDGQECPSYQGAPNCLQAPRRQPSYRSTATGLKADRVRTTP